MDTNNGPDMFFHTDLYSVLKFFQCRKGLYYFDNSDPNTLNPFVNTYSFLGTIQENNKFSHRSEIEVDLVQPKTSTFSTGALI